jgi:hypothetical protein
VKPASNCNFSSLGLQGEAVTVKGMPQIPNLLDQAIAFHRALPNRSRRYLNDRGIPDATIEDHLLGWNGERITIPIRNCAGEVAFFKLRKDPEDQSESPKMLATPGTHAELYGWDSVLANPESIIVCEGEFDRLVLESRGFAAVTSTGGAGTFRPEWAEGFHEIPNVYICFDHDEAGQQGAERVARLIQHAHVVKLPDEVGVAGDITDFFIRLGKTREDFLRLLEASRPLPPETSFLTEPDPVHSPQPMGKEFDQLKTLIRIEDMVRLYLPLRPSGKNLVGHCPFHDDKKPSFVVFQATQSFYCFGCCARGDVFTFLMRIENLTFPEALKVCRRLSPKHG